MIVKNEFWVKIKNVQRIHQHLYGSGMGWVVGWIILLLEHTGRKSGTRYSTPLQYEIIDGSYYVGSARGTQSDWYRNILVNPQIRVKIGRHGFYGWADPITDPGQVIAFLKYRFNRHPLMMGLMMKMHNLPMHPSETQLEGLAKDLAIVALHPGEMINEKKWKHWNL